MVKVKVRNIKNKEVSEMELPEAIVPGTVGQQPSDVPTQETPEANGTPKTTAPFGG